MNTEQEEVMQELIGKQFDVLDKGNIQVVDLMGNDDAIVQAARVSYGKGTKTVREDRGLIRYLMRHRHTTPFEMCVLKIRVKVPMDCWRQWIRHRTASVNEYSTRYSEAIDDKQETDQDQWRVQSKGNKQGSGGFLLPGLGAPDTGCPIHTYGDDDGRCVCLPGGFNLSEAEAKLHQHTAEVYQERLNAGVAREQARKDLPLSTYTEAYWQINLHNLFHFLSLRMDSHAQLEIRSYADIIGREIVAKWVPHAWEAFEDYRLNGMFLTGPEVAALQALIDDGLMGDVDYVEAKETMGKREQAEFEVKLNRIGVYV